MSAAVEDKQSGFIKNTYWMVGLGLLAIRVIQGFIYWGGGSRRPR